MLAFVEWDFMGELKKMFHSVVMYNYDLRFSSDDSVYNDFSTVS